jgi:hypothetical protein
MSDEIQRYDPTLIPGNDYVNARIDFDDDADGGWVKYADHAAALRARDEEIGRLRHSASYWQSEAERYAATIGARDERIAELERALLRKDAECKAGRECVGTRMIHETPMLVLEVNDRIGDPKIAGLHDARRRCDELEQP